MTQGAAATRNAAAAIQRAELPAQGKTAARGRPTEEERAASPGGRRPGRAGRSSSRARSTSPRARPSTTWTAADQLDYNRFLASAAHARGLAVGLKNDLEQVPDLVASFEWAIDEQCFQYDECGLLEPFTAAGKPVFEIEYGTEALATAVCPKANGLGFETLVKRLALDAWRISCR